MRPIHRNRSSFHHPRPIVKDDGGMFGLLPIRQVTTTYKECERGTFERELARIKEREQAELELKYPRPKRLLLPVYELGSEDRYVELPRGIGDAIESEVAA
jgi:hypothetical protein